MPNRTRKARESKRSHQDAKPYPVFPLTVHPSGRWCKKHRGSRDYFGKVEDGWQDALKKDERDWPYILEPGRPRPADDEPNADDGCTLTRLCNEFLNSKRRAVESGDLFHRTFHEYQRTTDLIIGQFGKRATPTSSIASASYVTASGIVWERAPAAAVKSISGF